MDRGLFDGRGGSARRGLATIAYLKARFDAGMDHLGMFQPFVEDAIRVADADGIELSVVQRLVREATGLSIPTDVVKTLLRRAAKSGLLTRSGGRYFRSEAHGEDTDLRERIKELERAHQGLATHLREFAEERGEELGTDEDALAALTKFLDVNHVGTVMPLVGGIAIPAFAKSGYSSLLPAGKGGASWLRHLGLKSSASATADLFGEVLSVAGELGSMDRLQLGLEARPQEEIDIRRELVSRLEKNIRMLNEGLNGVDEEIRRDVFELVAILRSGDIDFAAKAQAALDCRPAEIVKLVGCLSLILIENEYRMMT